MSVHLLIITSGLLTFYDMGLQMAAVPEEPDSAAVAADDVDEVFWAPINGLRDMKGEEQLSHGEGRT